MAHKPRYARRKPKPPLWQKLLPVFAAAVLAIVLILCLTGGDEPASAEDAQATAAATEESLPPVPVASATVGVQGDLLMHKPVLKTCSLEDGCYDFESIFRYVAPYTQGYNYAVANLETTLGGDSYPYQGYPHFNCPDELVTAAKDAGLDMLLTANNHSSDTSTDGLLRTVETVRSMGLTPLGSQLNDSEPKYTVVELNGIRVGMAAYTYANADRGGYPTLNYEPEVTQLGVINFYTEGNLEQFYGEVSSLLAQMKADGAEATMLYVHWGTEYTLQPDGTYSLQPDSVQQAMAQRLCDLGVDVIAGGHPHVVEPMALLSSNTDPEHKTVVIYSLGNAVSNQRRDQMDMKTGHTEDGALFTVTFEKYSDGSVYVSDVDVLPTWVNMSSVNGKLEYNILPLDSSRREQWKSLFNLTDELVLSAEQSYSRTMNIVGPGLEECRSYLSQQKQARGALPGSDNTQEE